MYVKIIFPFLLVLQSLVTTAQSFILDDGPVKNNLKKHISKLASDKFEGRETGTGGEQMATDYISKQFRQLNLEPRGTSGFIQEFTFTDGIKYDSVSTSLMIDDRSFKIEKDFYPLPYSANGKAVGELFDAGYGILAPKIEYNDYAGKTGMKGKIAVMEIGVPGGKKDSAKFAEYSDLRTRIDTAIAKGIAAIVFINSDTLTEDTKFRHRDIVRIAPSGIPVIFARGAAAIMLKLNRAKKIMIETSLIKTECKGHNVIGFMDNKAPYTVIIGAHLDHLGYGDAESSLYKGPRAIHNGADDNASGTAAVIEMACLLKTSALKNNNYLFICFSGEEKGLIGSSYYAKNPTIDLSKVNYMINMDMIGRLKKEDKTLFIYGTGTSPVWNEILPKVNIDSIKIKTTESGIGPSDHTSFYLKNIPVLHFFSGFHPDYHKPSDDEDKINYSGEVSIVKYMLTVITLADGRGKLVFMKTKEPPVSSKNTIKPRVTLGVIPDYSSAGEGMRIDGVSEGKPAAAAGLKAGDIITQIGEYKIVDIQSYMSALGHFKSGDQAKVKVKRGNTLVEMNVTF